MRIVAHSMGGLVVRAMIAARPDLWDRMCERDGARLVMLGTPNRGSHDIVEALLGTAATVQQLALLDLTHDTTEIVDIVARFPGVLELLPNDGDFFDTARWSGWSRTSAPARPSPARTLLAAARQDARQRAPDTRFRTRIACITSPGLRRAPLPESRSPAAASC